MPFSGVGFGEMLIIGMIILIVFGPQRLPEISRQFGKAMREFKRGMNEIQRELEVAEREKRGGTTNRTSTSKTPERPDTSAGEPRLAGPDASRPAGTQPARAGAKIPTFGRPGPSGEPPPPARERRERGGPGNAAAGESEGGPAEEERDPAGESGRRADGAETAADDRPDAGVGPSRASGSEAGEERDATREDEPDARPDPQQSDLFS